MEVQNANSGQTTVSWTSTTQFSKTVTKAVSALGRRMRHGHGHAVEEVQDHHRSPLHHRDECHLERIVCRFRHPDGSGAPGASAGRPPGGFQFRGGSGRPGFGGSNAEGGGTFGRGGTGNGSSNFRQQLASIAIASGKVKSVKGSTLTVSGFSLNPGQFTRGAATSSSKAKKPTPPKTQTLTITTSKSTTVSATQSAAATDLAVGDCVSAFGPAASNGAVTADYGPDHLDRGRQLHARLRPLRWRSGRRVLRRYRAVAVPKSSAGWGRTGHRRAVLIGAVVLVVVLGGGAAAWAEVGNGSAGYRQGTVTRADIATSMTVVGNVDPVSDAAASFQVAGQVATMTVTPGQQVTAGQTLGTLQTTALSEAVSSAESTLAADQAKLVEDEENQSSASSGTKTPVPPPLRRRRRRVPPRRRPPRRRPPTHATAAARTPR